MNLLKNKLLKKIYKKASKFVQDNSYPIPKHIIYELDLQGFTIIRNVLSVEQVDHFNALIDAYQQGKYPRKFPLINISPEFLALAEHPLLLKILSYALGEHLRLDHFFGQQSEPYTGELEQYRDTDSSKLLESRNIHSGPYTEQQSYQYHWHNGKMINGMMSAGFVLQDVGPDDGGLIFVPGSHKQNMTIEPIDINNLKWHGQSELQWVQPVVNKGDLVIFTEATVHGTTPWLVKDRPRRMAYFKFCPGYMCWRNYNEIAHYAEHATSETLKKLLRPPYVAEVRDDDFEQYTPNLWRTPSVE